ncbi:WbqC family protein [Spirosoma sp. KNUC1025]|uniref:WbqC family protein n=1 Tax=Spirosoma sp. KNUC1025 TaxID=2894082 RepID=UPI003866BDF9|nr:WbqC family protein [Spirosoma sp. KNUC1025]
MTIAIMQPYFLPYIGYIQLMSAVDTFILYDDVAFINRGWINRNRLLINGQEYLFTVPLKDASQNKHINEVHLADDPKWRSKLLKTIEQGYRKAPFYQTVMPLTEKIVNFTTDSIADLVHFSLLELIQYLSLSTQLIKSSSIYENSDLKAQARILDICLKEKATRYINPIGGIELYDKSTFAEAGIGLNFIKSRLVEYPQGNRGTNEFIPWLSIIDVLMYNDVTAVKEMLNEYDLI